jgi:hypothetical protein
MVRGEPELGHQNGRSGSPQAERGGISSLEAHADFLLVDS